MSEDKLRTYWVAIEEDGPSCIMEDIDGTVLDLRDFFDSEGQPFDEAAARQRLEAAPVGERLEFRYGQGDTLEVVVAFVKVTEMTRAELDALADFEGW